jgi:hypothetical protein
LQKLILECWKLAFDPEDLVNAELELELVLELELELQLQLQPQFFYFPPFVKRFGRKFFELSTPSDFVLPFISLLILFGLF